MASAFLSWLTQEGVGLILGVVLRALIEYLNERRADRAERDAGRLEAERRQAEAAAAQDHEYVDELSRPLDVDDALKRLKEGSA